MSISKLINRGPSLADSVSNSIRAEIINGGYAIGDKLPTERMLSDTYGVSRPIVREAINSLKRDGLVVTRQGLGAFVSETREQIFRFTSFDVNDALDIRNVIELLMAVEASATARAAERRTDNDVKKIKGRFDAMQTAIDRGESGVDEDMEFHRAIVEAANNPYFRDMSDFLDANVRNFIRKARENTARSASGLVQEVQEEHRAILQAITSKKAQVARKAAETHLIGAAKRLTLYMEP
ncbi:FadR/GntR family transcriptional regulator [Agrobacterium tumefaciens]|uniref:FadR/GntR family transcriptional regulator n=1 Tax=Agrobacterium tumefaciens TaxID=358 RepID=UPI000552DF99|nr:FadR/GntR family transcriptional regulator [Agrobacterium tumefaciens]